MADFNRKELLAELSSAVATKRGIPADRGLHEKSITAIRALEAENERLRTAHANTAIAASCEAQEKRTQASVLREVSDALGIKHRDWDGSIPNGVRDLRAKLEEWEWQARRNYEHLSRSDDLDPVATVEELRKDQPESPVDLGQGCSEMIDDLRAKLEAAERPCKLHPTMHVGSLGRWCCEVDRLRKVVVDTHAKLEAAEADIETEKGARDYQEKCRRELEAKLEAADDALEQWPADVSDALGIPCEPGEDVLETARRLRDKLEVAECRLSTHKTLLASERAEVAKREADLEEARAERDRLREREKCNEREIAYLDTTCDKLRCEAETHRSRVDERNKTAANREVCGD